MKRFLLIFCLFLSTGLSTFAQETDEDDDESIRDKMSEYIQQKLSLTDQEAKKFKPQFLQYFKEWRATIRENRGDQLVMRKKVADLQIRYRTRFSDVIGEQKSNQVFTHQQVFIRELGRIRDERKNRPRNKNRRNQ